MTTTNDSDSERLAFIEKMAKRSQSGVSFDWVYSVDGDDGGYRYMHRRHISGAYSTLRDAIDAAMRQFADSGRGSVTHTTPRSHHVLTRDGA